MINFKHNNGPQHPKNHELNQLRDPELPKLLLPILLFLTINRTSTGQSQSIPSAPLSTSTTCSPPTRPPNTSDAFRRPTRSDQSSRTSSSAFAVSYTLPSPPSSIALLFAGTIPTKEEKSAPGGLHCIAPKISANAPPRRRGTSSQKPLDPQNRLQPITADADYCLQPIAAPARPALCHEPS